MAKILKAKLNNIYEYSLPMSLSSTLVSTHLPKQMPLVLTSCVS